MQHGYRGIGFISTRAVYIPVKLSVSATKGIEGIGRTAATCRCEDWLIKYLFPGYDTCSHHAHSMGWRGPIRTLHWRASPWPCYPVRWLAAAVYAGVCSRIQHTARSIWVVTGSMRRSLSIRPDIAPVLLLKHHVSNAPDSPPCIVTLSVESNMLVQPCGG